MGAEEEVDDRNYADILYIDVVAVRVYNSMLEPEETKYGIRIMDDATVEYLCEWDSMDALVDMLARAFGENMHIGLVAMLLMKGDEFLMEVLSDALNDTEYTIMICGVTYKPSEILASEAVGNLVE